MLDDELQAASENFAHTKPMRIFHNPRCSKSRGALALLEENGVQPEIILYLDVPPTREELTALLAKLGMKPSELVRKNEAVCQEHYASRDMNEDDWLEAMLKHPVLIERPIIVSGEQAVIGRPPEKVLGLLEP